MTRSTNGGGTNGDSGELSSSQSPVDLKAAFERDGYVIVCGLIPDSNSSSRPSTNTDSDAVTNTTLNTQANTTLSTATTAPNTTFNTQANNDSTTAPTTAPTTQTKPKTQSNDSSSNSKSIDIDISLPALRTAARTVTTLAREGVWTQRRLVGRQFPPFFEPELEHDSGVGVDSATNDGGGGATRRKEDRGRDIWGVQHIMHPALGALSLRTDSNNLNSNSNNSNESNSNSNSNSDSDNSTDFERNSESTGSSTSRVNTNTSQVFARWYTSDGLVEAVKLLLGCEEGDLQMELFNLLVNPERETFALRWHRDDIRGTASEEEERRALALWHHGIQWNTALYDDESLFVVPGSHRVPRTAEQRALSETLEAPREPLEMPGAVKVKLKAGETVFYNSNILHCASYSCEKERATMHGCMGDRRGGGVRARNVLQHGVGWMRGEEFRESVLGVGVVGPGSGLGTDRDKDKDKDKDKEGSLRAGGMLDRLLEMANERPREEEVGYSLEA